jgi:chromosome segregation ATPase
MKLDLWQIAPYVLILGLGAVVMLDKSEITALKSKVKAEETVSASLNATIIQLQSGQNDLKKRIEFVTESNEYVVKQIELLSTKRTASQAKVTEIKDGRKQLDSDDVGPAMRFSLGQLREWHEADYGTSN